MYAVYRGCRAFIFPMAFEPLGKYLGGVRPQKKTRHSTYHQQKGSRIAAELDDRKNTGLYIFWCRWYEDSVVETARRQTKERRATGTVEEPHKYFTSRLVAIGGPLPKEAYASRKKRKVNKQLALKFKPYGGHT